MEADELWGGCKDAPYTLCGLKSTLLLGSGDWRDSCTPEPAWVGALPAPARLASREAQLEAPAQACSYGKGSGRESRPSGPPVLEKHGSVSKCGGSPAPGRSLRVLTSH